MILAGIPTAVAFGGTIQLRTTALAPILASSPIVVFLRILAPAPISTFFRL
jgi:hypothetical protein